MQRDHATSGVNELPVALKLILAYMFYSYKSNKTFSSGLTKQRVTKQIIIENDEPLYFTHAHEYKDTL